MASCRLFEIYTCLVLLSVFLFARTVATEKEYAPRYLAKDEYAALVESGQRFLVNFVSPGCVKCSEFAPEYDEVARYFATEKKEMNINVFIEGELSVIRRQGLRRLPSLYYVRDKTPILYNGHLKADSVIQWVELTGRKIHVTLTDEDFEHLTQASTGATTGDWIVLFCDVTHSDGSVLLPMWESIAYRLHSIMNVAVVDIPHNPGLVKRFNLPEQPTMHLFRRGKRYLYNLQQRDDNAIMSFATNGYKQMSGVDVEVGPSPFDDMIENIADQLKTVVPPEHASKVLLILGSVVVVLLLLCCCCLRSRSKEEEPLGRTKKGV